MSGRRLNRSQRVLPIGFESRWKGWYWLEVHSSGIYGSKMRPLEEWDQSDLQSMIDNQVSESINLVYKMSDVLSNKEDKKNEISKDVSAFANSDGGVIIYGIAEDRQRGSPSHLDDGIPQSTVTKEWLEQVINSRIRPKIDGLFIKQIPSPKPDHFFYALRIPKSMTRAPHQAHDKRYYKRYNFESVPMEDYEVRDVMRRSATPNLITSIRLGQSDFARIVFTPGSNTSEEIPLSFVVRNDSDVVAEYSIVFLFIDNRLHFKAPEGYLETGSTQLGHFSLRRFAKKRQPPTAFPIIRGVNFDLFDVPFSVRLKEEFLSMPEFLIVTRITAPGFSADQKFFILNRNGNMEIKAEEQ